MAYSIIDYAILNAHKDFTKLPFSKIDGLIFSQLAYLSYDNIVPDISYLIENKDISRCENEIIN